MEVVYALFGFALLIFLAFRMLWNPPPFHNRRRNDYTAAGDSGGYSGDGGWGHSHDSSHGGHGDGGGGGGDGGGGGGH
jgi:hypothetical protein